MAEKAGKMLLLQLDVGGGSYSTIGGLKTKEYSFSNEEIDVTNHGSNEWKTILDGAGTKQMEVSGSGVHNGDSSTLDALEDAVLDGTLVTLKVYDSDSGRSYSGSFKVTEFSRTGSFDGAQEYSLSAKSSGEVTVA